MKLLSFKKVLFTLAAVCTVFSVQAANVYDLRCEMLRNPWGIDNTAPHLSWKISSNKIGTKQTAYQILAASDARLLTETNADLWNSGKVKTDESIWINYNGKALASRSVIYWKVRIWDENSKSSSWSKTAVFSVGFLNASDWKAQFIGLDLPNGEPQSPLFWKTIECKNKNSLVLLHVNSLGYHEIYINGKKVSDAVLAPAMVQFDKHSLILTYNVTKFMKKGANELVIWLGKGWYRGQMPGVIAGGPFVRAQMETSDNGNWETLAQTDASWKGKESGYISTDTWNAHHFGGEIVDAKALLPDFTSASLNKAQWKGVKVAAITTNATPQMVETNKIQYAIHPATIKSLDNSSWYIDMGTNLTGWTKIDFPKLEAGQKVTIEYTDFLQKGQTFDNKKDLYSDEYIASGKDKEHFINKFNYHAYRYIRIKNLHQALKASDITAYLIHTGYENSSSFECSDSDMNAIHNMIHYTLRCLTLSGYMVDCPQIERLGYGGDGNASTLTLQTMYDVAPLYTNWMQAWGDCIRSDGGMPHTAPCPYSAGGGPFWCGFIITASWQTYVNYGDPRLLMRYYPTMQKWLEYVKAYTKNGLLTKWPNNEYRNWYLGDWAAPNGIDVTDSTSVGLVNNCFISVCYDTMSKIAALLGKESDKTEYLNKRDAYRKAVQDAFYNPRMQSYASGSQIDLVYPILSGVTPQSLISDVQQSLFIETQNRFNGHLYTGLVGVPIITQWATQNRQADFMYNMLKKRDFPGYLYMIDNGGTTTWEHWKGERSYIHNCYNGIGSWFYQALGGILPDENHPGYRHVFIQPQLADGISWVKTSKNTPFGKLSVEWNRDDKQFVLDVDIPVGCSATIAFPTKGKEASLNGEKIDVNKTIEAKSGHYKIISIL